MASNSFGSLFRFTTWGESHGPAIGVVIDGCPPLLQLSEEDIQYWLDRRRPGQSAYTTQRKEADKVKILSGTFEGMTTGAPISLLIENTDARPADYEAVKDVFRPGHADFTYQAKYGIRDHRGGGRASARETACRVAAGAVARKILGGAVDIRGGMIQLGVKKIDRSRCDWNETSQNPFFCPDPDVTKEWAEYLEQTMAEGSSIGAMIEIVAKGVPAGLGDPVYEKLDSELARAMMSINAVKGVEIGDGFSSVLQTGSENGDEMCKGKDGNPRFLSNHSGGILGGISTGQDIIVRFAVKPTSSIPRTRKTIDKNGNETEIHVEGRHDPCIGIRAVPVGEAMVACVLADALLKQAAMRGYQNARR